MGFWRRLFRRNRREARCGTGTPIVFATYSWTNPIEEARPHEGTRPSSSMTRDESIDLSTSAFFDDKLIADPNQRVTQRALTDAWNEWKSLPGNRVGKQVVTKTCMSLVHGLKRLLGDRFAARDVQRDHRTTRYYYGIKFK